MIESIKNYFDASYEADINSLKKILEKYLQAIQLIPNKAKFEENPKFEVYAKDFELKYSAFLKVVEGNKKLIDEKMKTPSVSITLKKSTKVLEELNEVIAKINALITVHNINIDQKETVKSTIKKAFWEIMRWDYDQTISSINTDKTSSKSKTDALENTLNRLCCTKI